MIDFLALGLLIWTILAMVADSHRRSKSEYILTETGLPTFERTEPPELSLIGKIAVLPITAGEKIMDLLGVVWNQIFYKNEREYTESKRKFLKKKSEENKEYWKNKREVDRE